MPPATARSTSFAAPNDLYWRVHGSRAISASPFDAMWLYGARVSTFWKRMPKLPKFAVMLSAVTDSAVHGSMYVVARYHEFIDDTASDCTSAGDAIARATSGLFGFETARSWEQA